LLILIKQEYKSSILNLKDIIILIKIIKLYKINLKNRKFIIIYKVIYINKNKPLLLYIIISGKKIIKA
jgi:hypothetical protein